MGRAGRSGGSSGGFRSGSSRSFSSSSPRGGSSHSMGSRSGRPAGSSSSGFTSRPSVGASRPGPGPGSVRPSAYIPPVYKTRVPPPPPPAFGPLGVGAYGYRPEPVRRRSGGGYGWIAVLIVVCIIAIIMFGVVSAATSTPASTYAREKLDGSYGYQSGSIVDELGWIDDTGRMSRDLKVFYNKTGVQPYIYLAAGRSDLIGDEAGQRAFADAYYSANCPNEACVLLVYFDTGDPAVDGDMTLVYGREAGAIFDDEAMAIFWSYMDQYWYSSMSEREVFTEAFLHTGNRIMSRTATMADAALVGAVAVVIVIAAVIVFKAVRVRREHERQRNQETADILNANIHADSGDDELLGKWSDPED